MPSSELKRKIKSQFEIYSVIHREDGPHEVQSMDRPNGNMITGKANKSMNATREK